MRLIWPWQDVHTYAVSANATEPPVDFYESFHVPCHRKVHDAIHAQGYKP